MKENASAQKSYLAFFLLTLFQAFLVGNYHFHFHEPWRDEVQHLLLAKETTGFFSLLHALRYEGHPFVLHLYMKGLLLFFEPRTTLAIVSGTGYFVLSIATFFLFLSGKVTLKPAFLFALLISWSYEATYEMGVIARGYAMGMGFALAGLGLLISYDRHAKPWMQWTGVTFFVFAILTSIHSALLTVCFIVPFIVRSVVDRRRFPIARMAIPLLIAFTLLAYVVYEPGDRIPSGVSATITGVSSRLAFCYQLWTDGTYLPSLLRNLGQLLYHYSFPTYWWNIEFAQIPKWLGERALSLVLVFTAAHLLFREARFSVPVAAGAGFLVLVFDCFFRFLYTASFRHHLFLVHPLFLLMSLYWLGKLSPERLTNLKSPEMKTRLFGLITTASVFLLSTVGVFQVFASGLALSHDYLWYFSQSGMVEQLIPDNENVLIAVENDYSASAMPLWRPKAHFHSRMGGGRRFSYVLWDRDRLTKKVSLSTLLIGLCRQVQTNPKLTLYFFDTRTDFTEGSAFEEVFEPSSSAPTAVQTEKFIFYKVDCDSDSLRAPQKSTLASTKSMEEALGIRVKALASD